MRRRTALIAGATALLVSAAVPTGATQAAESRVPEGTYQIVSENPEAGHLDFAPYTIPIWPPIYFVVGSHKQDRKEQWKVTSTEGGLYTINSTTHPRASLAFRGDTIVASEGDRGEFSIERVGHRVFKIRVPDEDRVATLNSAGDEQLHVERENGTPSQWWRFERVS
ncbi:RICIN domain-containing protein [Streptomyces sp. NBC_01508]|uniref:RICIN domain-containing protein n=1 Tax=Streptomyces sp. NBC_01508 TaxID=2903888 RepID=UPI0038688D5A